MSGQWYMDRKISLGNIIVTLTIILGVMFWVNRMEGFIKMNALSIEHNAQAIERIEKAVSQCTEAR